MNNNIKAEKILDIALKLLKSGGDHALTMRKVAVTADMSLSNVQYYYKNKNELLKAMADRYFKQCLDIMKNHKKIYPSENLNADLLKFLRGFLDHGIELSDMCRIFREYWAISTRNSVIDAYIKDYYLEMAKMLSEKLRPIAKSDKALSQAVSFIIPFSEGYSITGTAMPEQHDNIVEMIFMIVMRLLQEEY